MSPDITGVDCIRAEVSGEEMTVWNHVYVSTKHYVNSVNGYETFGPSIRVGDGSLDEDPEAVTERVAQLLLHEFGVDVNDLGIMVVDIEDEEVALM